MIDTPLILLLAAAFSTFAHRLPLSPRTSAPPSFRFFVSISSSVLHPNFIQAGVLAERAPQLVKAYTSTLIIEEVAS